VLATLLFYNFTETIGGWRFHEALIPIGLLYVSFGFLDAVLYGNVEQLALQVRKGTLDFVLTKPVNSQFHATLQRIRLDRLTALVGGVVLIGYALVQLRAEPSAAQWLLFVLLALGAMVLLYAVMAILGTLVFWSHEIRGFAEIIYALLEIGRYPTTALPEPLRAVMTFILPIAFVTTVPAEVLLGKVTSAAVFYGWLFAIALFAFCVWFWRYAVRRYSSAA
jgi:ABC-2 type transport system permease protein